MAEETKGGESEVKCIDPDADGVRTIYEAVARALNVDKMRGVALVMRGPPGCGKSELAKRLVERYVELAAEFDLPSKSTSKWRGNQGAVAFSADDERKRLDDLFRKVVSTVSDQAGQGLARFHLPASVGEGFSEDLQGAAMEMIDKAAPFPSTIMRAHADARGKLVNGLLTGAITVAILDNTNISDGRDKVLEFVDTMHAINVAIFEVKLDVKMEDEKRLLAAVRKRAEAGEQRTVPDDTVRKMVRSFCMNASKAPYSERFLVTTYWMHAQEELGCMLVALREVIDRFEGDDVKAKLHLLMSIGVQIETLVASSGHLIDPELIRSGASLATRARALCAAAL